MLFRIAKPILLIPAQPMFLVPRWISAEFG
jgi:hypothetical protein